MNDNQRPRCVYVIVNIKLLWVTILKWFSVGILGKMEVVESKVQSNAHKW